MPQATINNIYLPLARDLIYQSNLLINATLLETQSGTIIPTTTIDKPINKIFSAQNISITPEELTLLQNFYQKYYLQKFRFKDFENTQKTLVTIETPNNILTQFNLVNDMPNLLYLLNNAKIYVNNTIVTSATINQNLQITFTNPPASNSVIKVVLDYDYAVMFDYHFGLQSVFDNKTQTFKVSFQLNSF